MSNLRTLGLSAALAALALSMFSASASADKVTSPTGTTYTGTIKASSEGTTSMHGPFTTVECKNSTFEAKVESHGVFLDVSGNISTLKFEECNYGMATRQKGSFAINETSGGNGEFSFTGTEITAFTSFGECIWGTSSTTIGTFTGSNTGNATIDVNGELPRVGGSPFCGSVGYFIGAYKVTTPSTLSAD